MLSLAVRPSDPNIELALWNAADVGEYLGIHQSTVWTYLAQGLIPAPIRLGGSVKWQRADIVLFLDCDCDMKKFRQRKRVQDR
ncbi:helix-turn-helix transcriptional regulator [Symmachiella dynata]|uniref:helix-turn-helix transcriptional regulator n=1 Tax=Symmachiella dynata TaxID=2527995 RepID=UPI003C6FD1F7